MSLNKTTEKSSDSIEDPDSATLMKMVMNVNNYAESGESDSECASTDGEESDPNSPISSDQ